MSNARLVDRAPASWRAYMLPCALLALSALVIAGHALQPTAGKPIAAIFPPWWDAGHSMSVAASIGTPILRLGGLPAVVILKPDDTASVPALTARARKAGAWFVVNAGLLGGCAIDPAERV